MPDSARHVVRIWELIRISGCFFFFFAVYEFTAKQLCAAINATLNYVIALANLDVASRGRKGRFLSAVAYFRFYLYRNLTARNHSAVGDSG